MEPYFEIARAVGERARELRLLRNLQQSEVAERAGLTRGTIVRFEKTGRTSLDNAIRIATVLGVEDGFAALFQPPKYRSLDEALARPAARERQRVRKPRGRTR